MKTDEIRTPIVVIGGGPTGTMLAMELAWRGVDCTVVEANTQFPQNPRCNTINARSMEFLRRLGIADEIRSLGLPTDHPTDVVDKTKMTGYELTRYDLPSSSQARSSAALTPGDWPTAEPQHRVSQLYFDPVLRAKAQSMTGLNYLLGWCFERYEQTGDGVVAHISRADGSEHKVIRARYLVGADGAQSAVRRKMGSQLEGIPHLAQVSSTFLRSQRLQEINLENPAWMYRFFSRGRLGSLVAINGEDLWLYHAPMPSQNSDQTFDARQELFNAVGEEFDYEILNQEEWVARAMVVNRYRNRNVFVAGDAAHVWTPMGGFGMNAGIADATNLSWKLAGVMQEVGRMGKYSIPTNLNENPLENSSPMQR